MKGYKAFNDDWTCRGFQYEVGKTYEMKEAPIICKKGFHFCEELKDCFFYYPFDYNRTKIAEVEALGDIKEDNNEGTSKRCTNKIRIVREILFTNLDCKTEYITIKYRDTMPTILNTSSVQMFNDGQYPVLNGEGHVLETEVDISSDICTHLISYNRIIDIKEIDDGI